MSNHLFLDVVMCKVGCVWDCSSFCAGFPRACVRACVRTRVLETNRWLCQCNLWVTLVVLLTHTHSLIWVHVYYKSQFLCFASMLLCIILIFLLLVILWWILQYIDIYIFLCKVHHWYLVLCVQHSILVTVGLYSVIADHHDIQTIVCIFL